MAIIMFVDDRMDEIKQQCAQAGFGDRHTVLHLQPFVSIEQTCCDVKELGPDIVLVGYGLGAKDVTGADVVRALRKEGYRGIIFANSGGPIEQFSGVLYDNAERRGYGINEAIQRFENQIIRNIRDQINRVNSDDAQASISYLHDYILEEKIVDLVLRECCKLEVIETALKCFARSQPKNPNEHGYWVHSLSHFTSALWQRRTEASFDTLLKDLYFRAFDGAVKTGNYNCCVRLIRDFSNYADWDDDPAAFHLTPDVLKGIKEIEWVKSDEPIKALINHGPFKSGAEFEAWKAARK